MAPKTKFTKEEMVAAAVAVVRKQGYEALTAQSIARELGVSTRPIFTCFDTMEEVRKAVCEAAVAVYEAYAQKGLEEKIPFYGLGMQYIRFAQEEPELYRLLFLSRTPGALAAMQRLQALARPTLMQTYRLSSREADRYFRDMWLVAHSLSVLIVTGDCPYSDPEIGKILTGFSVSLCKAMKEIPGFADGHFDRDAVFQSMLEGRE